MGPAVFDPSGHGLGSVIAAFEPGLDDAGVQAAEPFFSVETAEPLFRVETAKPVLRLEAAQAFLDRDLIEDGLHLRGVEFMHVRDTQAAGVVLEVLDGIGHVGYLQTISEIQLRQQVAAERVMWMIVQQAVADAVQAGAEDLPRGIAWVLGDAPEQ